MRNNIIVKKIIAYTEKLQNYCSGMTYEEFTADTKLVEACVFNLSQIGELANKLDQSFTQKYPHIYWKAMYSLRNRIVHDYDGVNLSIIWQTISEDMKPLQEDLTQIINDI